LKQSTLKTLPDVAVVGCGYWGKNLVRNFHNLNALKLICDSNESCLEKLKSQYNGIDTCLALSEVLFREDIKGVVIAATAETHFNLVREAILADKHVFVEKPMALHENEGRELIRLAHEKNRILMVGHLLQYHPVFAKLKEMVSNGELGRVNYIYSHRLNLGKIRREENILWSFAPHDISMIISLVGEMPEKVMCTGGNYLHQKIADVTTTHLAFPSGLKAHIFVSWLHPFKEQKLVIVGESKMAVFDDTQLWEDKLLIYPHVINWQNNIPIPTKAEPEQVIVEQDEPLKNECLHFLECIVEKKQPITDGREGLNVLKILNASQSSLNDNGGMISLQVETPKNDVSVNGNAPAVQRTESKASAKPSFFVHPTAVVDENVSIGSGSKIWHFSHIIGGSIIGDNCNLGQNVMVGPDVKIGNNCKIQNNVSVFKGVTLEDGVFCGPSMVFTNVYNPRAEIRRMDELRTTVVKRGATIGANATVVCGHTLGRYCFIGAGAVVLNDVADHAMMVGNPAKQKGWMCICGIKLHFNNGDAVCEGCQRRYKETKMGTISEISNSEINLNGI
jgi:UDP-2-acetamido-3-amino-2,3-dideoxy-glucuronate N-acetyltransferase